MPWTELLVFEDRVLDIITYPIHRWNLGHVQQGGVAEDDVGRLRDLFGDASFAVPSTR
jgi:hypothetical protein